MHGKTSIITQTQKSKIFQNIPNQFKATRYHSFVVDKKPENRNFIITSFSNDGEIMSIESKKYNIFGVQFHPESIMSEFGHQMLKNFLDLSPQTAIHSKSQIKKNGWSALPNNKPINEKSFL